MRRGGCGVGIHYGCFVDGADGLSGSSYRKSDRALLLAIHRFAVGGTLLDYLRISVSDDA